MRRSLMVLLLTVVAFAQEKNPTIDLKVFDNPKLYSRTDTALTVGKKTYQFVNIRPLQGDTACISAIVIDKRKLVFFDLFGDNVARGLQIPKSQPVKDALIVLKGSPTDGKAFFISAKGKLAALPGTNILVDPAGSSIFCVWDNDGTWRLTVFDYRSMKVVFPTTVIAKPEQWFSGVMDYWFKAAGAKEYYKVEILSKSVVKNTALEDGVEPVSYSLTFKGDPKTCCGKLVQ